jgi:hypothetical protein
VLCNHKKIRPYCDMGKTPLINELHKKNKLILMPKTRFFNSPVHSTISICNSKKKHAFPKHPQMYCLSSKAETVMMLKTAMARSGYLK